MHKLKTRQYQTRNTPVSKGLWWIVGFLSALVLCAALGSCT